MIFTAHGNYSVALQNNILTLELIGGFNLEGVQKSCADALKLAKSKNLNSWQMLLTLDKETLMVWEAIDDIRQFLLLCSELGCQFFAYTIVLESQEVIIDKIFQTLNLEYKCFSKNSDSLQWLQANQLN